MIFKIYNCDFGIKVNGTTYDFTDVAELQIEDNEKNRLVRGSNGKNTEGLAYREGIKDPKKWTIPILNMSAALKGVLDGVYKDDTLGEAYCLDSTDGSRKGAEKGHL